ncbi:conserved hypothetical protein [Hyphomicrobiales bacterium]|nr:conserved hypothetical protein [Hyphomicrobiales bacterium]CAH1668425.1 conserved hypothetical protein [Hyphomicrobiales bacterium]
MRRWGVIGAAVAMATAACQQIQHSSDIAQPIGQSVTAGVGDVIFRADEKKSMPNAFGRADLFGRTTTTGMTAVQYGGLRNGNALLVRSGVDIQSNQTTMNSTPIYVPTQQTTSVSGWVGTTPVMGTASSSGGYLAPPIGAQGYSAARATIPIEVDWRKNPAVPMSGRTLYIENATPTSITYSIR